MACVKEAEAFGRVICTASAAFEALEAHHTFCVELLNRDMHIRSSIVRSEVKGSRIDGQRRRYCQIFVASVTGERFTCFLVDELLDGRAPAEFVLSRVKDVQILWSKMPRLKDLGFKALDNILVEKPLNIGRLKIHEFSGRKVFPLQACFGGEVVIYAGIDFQILKNIETRIIVSIDVSDRLGVVLP